MEQAPEEIGAVTNEELSQILAGTFVEELIQILITIPQWTIMEDNPALMPQPTDIELEPANEMERALFILMSKLDEKAEMLLQAVPATETERQENEAKAERLDSEAAQAYELMFNNFLRRHPLTLEELSERTIDIRSNMTFVLRLRSEEDVGVTGERPRLLN